MSINETTTDEQAVRAVVTEWIRASEAGDYAALEPLMHPDIVFLTPGNEPMGHDVFREGFLNVVKTMRIHCTSDIREVEIHGDLAHTWQWLEVGIQSTAGDVNIERKGHVLSIYKRNAEGRWQLWRDANLMLK